MQTLEVENQTETAFIGSIVPTKKESGPAFSAREAVLSPVKLFSTKEILKMDSESSKSNLIIVATPDGNKLVNTCSDQYVLTPLSHIINPLEAELSKYFDYDVCYRHSGHCRFFIDYIMKDVHNISTKDGMRPKIRIQHSYSGDVKYEVLFGFWRQVCSNGMHANVLGSQLKKKHTSHMEFATEETIGLISSFLNQAKDYIKKYKVLGDHSVTNLEDRILEVIAGTGFPKSYAEIVAQRARFEADAIQTGQPMNDWLIYNAFNFQLNHNRDIKMQEQNKVKLDMNILNFLNQ